MTAILDNSAALPITPPPLAPGAIVHVAYSGGLDSTVLLHFLAHYNPRFRLRAVHIHHGLQALADEWAEKCARFSATLGVSFELLKVQIDGLDPAGPEAAARDARYEALRGLMQPGDCLATAHHRSDQAETVLLRLLRGSGVQGLSAMRVLRPFPPGWLWRPFLELPREQLYGYAQEHGLRWIEDPHNRDPRYSRSWLRSELTPLLRERFPQVEESLARTARLSAEASILLDELAVQDLAQAGQGEALGVSALLALSAPRRHNLLRYWLRRQGFEMPAADMLDRVEREVLAAAEDAEPLLVWAGCELRRYRDRLYAMAPLPPPPAVDTPLAWTSEQLGLPPGCGLLRLPVAPPPGLSVRFMRGGERFRPAQGAYSRTLKNLFQEAGVPPWVRLRTPLVEAGGELIYIAGVGGNARWRELFPGTAEQPAWLQAPVGAASG
ncbi:tRNA lysidine(34) synthetase TilS [Nevskia soli]|uniref:tRNA lysidine(34) synthetase TilS n=1 Tax=Nevskia soli TaxID=418856 RepID=UPI0006892EAA|nr:tRNA lysidine(34) synthetase TilS [Nevskia soli]